MTQQEVQEEFGLLLRNARKKKGMTLEELGEATGLGRCTIMRMELAYQGVTLFKLMKLAHALGIPPAKLVPVDRQKSKAYVLSELHAGRSLKNIRAQLERTMTKPIVNEILRDAVKELSRGL